MFKRIILILAVVANLFAGFDFGNLAQDGNGKFEQYIQENKTIDVDGIIPIGVKDLKIYLTSTKDVDVQLFDKDNGNALVGWHIGALIGDGSSYAKTKYNGLTIEYSGYNGDGTGLGNEYIKITGTTKNRLIMKAFGYKAGTATIKYSWKGVSQVKDSGMDSFSSSIKQGKRIQLEGILPAGIDNLSVSLSANDDIDIELYNADNGDFVVGWVKNGNSAIISSGNEITRKYNGDTITWSGWNGRYNHTSTTSKEKIPTYNSQTEKGKEYIRIHGKSNNSYIMKVYGYKKGTATVNYQWGDNLIFAAILGQAKMLDEKSNKVNTYKASNGVLTNFWGTSVSKGNGNEYSGLDGYLNNNYETVAKYINGLPAITMRLSAINRGGGDVILFDSGNSHYVFNYLKTIISENTRNKLYFAGHSSGGGDIQNLMWKFKDSYYHIVNQTFQIDSAELPFLGDDDNIIPSNVKEAFNFYQDEDIASFVTEQNIKAKDSSKTKIHNIKISNPTRGIVNDTQIPHEIIDNDKRVRDKIISEIIDDFKG